MPGLMGLALGVVLAAAPDGGVEAPEAPDGGPALSQASEATAPRTDELHGAEVRHAPGLHLRGAAEAALGPFPSGAGENGLDLLLALRPVVAFSVGASFAVELGPTFRLRVLDFAPDNRSADFGGVLRRADWDETSDFGAILESLSIGTQASPFFLKAGAVRKKTLGLGHVLNRYSNQDNADYHPAGGTMVLALGPLRAEVFASDVLGGRLFAGELAWDLGRTFSSSTGAWDRYGLSLEAAHDFSRAGLPYRAEASLARARPPEVTFLHVDGWAVLARTASVRAMLLGGVGTRMNEAADLGLVVGGAVDATVAEVGLSVKGELRKQAGGFRHGFFGPGYELGRYADTGRSGTPRASAIVPDGFSVYGEVRLGVGTAVALDAAVEHFFFGRTDLDAATSLALLRDWLVAEARFGVVGVGQVPRFSATGAVRARLFSSFYVVGSGGTVFFPQPDGTLLRGVTVMVGVGVDAER